MALAGLTMASCTQEHIDVQYNPENVVAPVLGDIEDIDLSVDEADIVVEYTNADFNVATSNDKDLYINIQGDDMSKKVKITAKFEDKITIKVTDLYAAYLALGVEPGTEETFDIMINAYLTTDKGALVAGTETLSNFVSVNISSEAFVAPTMGEFTDVVLKEKTPDFVIDYTEAEFNIAAKHNVSYGLYVDLKGNKLNERVQVNKVTFEEGKMTIKAEELNKAVLALDVEGGADADVDIAVVASVDEIKKSDIMSDLQTVNIKTYAANIPPAEKYNKVWVIGDYCGWNHAKTQFLFDYEDTGTTFTGVVDFADAEGVSKAAKGFKLTGVAGWDDSCNWGLEDNTTAESEASSLQLITGGGSQDIKSYAKRFYGFEFDETTLVLKKTWGADQIGVIGLNGNWDTDIVMKYNPKWARFYADIEAAADTEIKFRADGGWDLNWGVDCAQGGGNIPVAAGKYRVYFNPATGLIEFNAKAYNTTEDTGNGGGTTPEPEPEEPEGPVTEPDRWGVSGTFTEWGKQADLYMSEVAENLFVRMGVTLTDADQFKVRFNNDWNINYGAAGDDDSFAVTVGEELALVAGGKNLSAPAGTYDIFFNIVDYKIWVMPEGETPGGVEVKTLKIYGDVSATGWTNCNAWIWDDSDTNYTGGKWPGQALATETVDDKEYYVFNVTPEMMGKTVNVIFNNGSEQTVNIEGIELNDDVIITLTEKEGGDGNWLATVNGEAPVEPEKPAETTYGLLGEFNGWGEDIDLVARGDGWYVTEGLSVTAGKLLIRLNDAWDEKFGNDGSTLVLGENTLTYGGADMLIEAGTYDFYFNPATSKLFLVNAGDEDPTAGLVASISYGLVGTINGWSAPDVKFEAIGDGGYKLLGYTLAATEQIKIRANEEWNNAENYGLASAGVLTTNAANILICGGGSANMSVAADGTYDFYFYPAELTLYVMEAGQVPAR